MVCVNIDIMKTFFTLGYMSEYLPVGIAFGVIIGVYTFFRLRSFLRSFGKDPKTKNMRILRLAAALVPLAFCANIWATSNVLALYIFFAGALAEYHFDQMTHFTSSGFTGWGWPVRNAYYCEYVVVDIQPAS